MEHLNNVLSDVVNSGELLTIQPGGNHGDSLIYHGFEKYISETDINQVRLDNDRFRYDAPPDFPTVNLLMDAHWIYKQWQYGRNQIFNDISAIYIHGGGNFNDLWKVGIQCYLTAARYFDCPIIIGPQSCQFEETNPTAIFEKVSNETHFFCRERYSQDIIEEAAESCDHVNVYLEEDTALFLNVEDLPIQTRNDEYTLLAMRMDQDSVIPEINEDISAPIKVSDISKMEDTYEDWINTAAKAKHIYTDRLHVAILGWILEKPITWYDTGYHKNKGVYEYSLSKEPNIEFRYTS